MALEVYIVKSTTTIGEQFAKFIDGFKTVSYPNGNGGIAHQGLRDDLKAVLPNCVVRSSGGNARECGSITVNPNKMTHRQRRLFRKAEAEKHLPQYKGGFSTLAYIAWHDPIVENAVSNALAFINRKLPELGGVTAEFDGQEVVFVTPKNMFNHYTHNGELDNRLGRVCPIRLTYGGGVRIWDILSGLARLNPEWDRNTFDNAVWRCGASWDVSYKLDEQETFDYQKLIKTIMTKQEKL